MTEPSATLSEKLTQTARVPIYRGAIFQMEADEKGLALVDCKVQSLKIYVLIDPDSDQVLETRFFTYGGPILTALADMLCHALQGLNVANFPSLSAAQLELALRDTPEIPALSLESPELGFVDTLITLLHSTYPEKRQIALAARSAMSSTKLQAHSAEGRAQADSEWNALTAVERRQRIEEALDRSVRQMLYTDGGGIEILELIDKNRVKIRYQGACAGCGSSSGATLYYIESQLREQVYYNLSVEPENPFGSEEPFHE
jgi:NifU-like protein